jgi:hypothetical protein
VHDDDVTPAQVIRETWRWFPAALTAGIALIALFTILSLFVWHVGGVFQAKSIQRNYANTVGSQSYQASLLAEMEQHAANITGPGGVAAVRAGVPAGSPEQVILRAQELRELSLLCSESVTFQPGTAPGSQQFESIVTANCLAGAPVSAPPLADPIPSGA